MNDLDDTMNKKTAARLINEHLDEYENRLENNPTAMVDTFYSRTGMDCPLCQIASDDCISKCINWKPLNIGYCMGFISNVNIISNLSRKRDLVSMLRRQLELWTVDKFCH